MSGRSVDPFNSFLSRQSAMDPKKVRDKFGDDYVATERTYRLGIGIRLAKRIAQRFRGRTVLETCTGAGFATIALTQVATRVVTIEIDPEHHAQARANVRRAGLQDKVTFLLGDALADDLTLRIQDFDAAFLDPDWAVAGPDHVYRFRRSNMRPPADALLEKVLRCTENVALILPPYIDCRELEDLPSHELQRIYLGETHALYCVYFGALAETEGETELRA